MSTDTHFEIWPVRALRGMDLCRMVLCRFLRGSHRNRRIPVSISG